MSISKNLSHHSFKSFFNSYLSIIIGGVMLLGLAGCERCRPGTGDQIATDLQVTLTPLLLEGPNQKTAVLTIATKGKKNDVDRLQDFNVNLKVSAVGKVLKSSGVSFQGYDALSQESTQTIKLDSKNEVEVQGLLYNYINGGKEGTLEYTEQEEVTFNFAPDTTENGDIESMTIQVIIANNKTNQEVFKGETTWQRSRYDFKIIGLDQDGFINANNNECLLEVTNKAGADISLDELENLEIKVQQDPAQAPKKDLIDPQDPVDSHFNEEIEQAGQKIIKFGSDELENKKITKKLIVIPGTRKEEIKFTFLLAADSQNTDGEALAIAKYRPVVVPYTLAVNQVGSTKNFELTIQDAGGQNLKLDELEKLKLKIKRTSGKGAEIASNKSIGGDNFELELKDGNALILSDDRKTATKNLTINTLPINTGNGLQNDLQVAFECVLVDSNGKVMADQQLVQWGIAIVATINYNYKDTFFGFGGSMVFSCELVNSTGEEIKNVNIAWEDMDNTGVEIAGRASGNKTVNLVRKAVHKEDFKIDWKGKNVARFKFTVTTLDGVVVYQKEHPITQAPPHLVMSVENTGDSFKVGEQVQLKIKAEQNVDENGLKAAKFQYTSSSSAALTIDGQDVQGKNVQELLGLAKAENVHQLHKDKEYIITLTITSQDERLSGGTFKNINLENTYRDNKKPHPVGNINWIGKMSVAMQPAEPLRVMDIGADKVFFADGNKQFHMIFTNNSKFPLDEVLLSSMQLSIVPVTSNGPEKVLYQTLDLQNKAATLWDVCQASGKRDLKPGKEGEIKIPFTIVGERKFIDFEIHLQDDKGNDITIQKVRLGSVYANQVAIVNSGNGLSIQKVKDSSPTSLDFEVENTSENPLEQSQLEKLSIQLRRTADRNSTVGIRKVKNVITQANAYSSLLEEDVKAKVNFFEREIALSTNDVPITLAQILQKKHSKNSLNAHGKMTINLSMTPEVNTKSINGKPNPRKRNFLVCIVDDQGIVVSSIAVKEQ